LQVDGKLVELPEQQNPAQQRKMGEDDLKMEEALIPSP